MGRPDDRRGFGVDEPLPVVAGTIETSVVRLSVHPRVIACVVAGGSTTTNWQTPATWFFTIGSFLFAAKPTLKLWREIRLYRMGKTQKLADRIG